MRSESTTNAVLKANRNYKSIIYKVSGCSCNAQKRCCAFANFRAFVYIKSIILPQYHSEVFKYQYKYQEHEYLKRI